MQTIQPTAHPDCADCDRLIDNYATAIQALLDERRYHQGRVTDMDSLALAVIRAEVELHDHEHAEAA